MSESKPSLADLVAQEREALVPPAATRARNLEGLRAALAEGRAPIVDVPPSAVTGGSTGSAGIVIGAVALGGLVLAAALWLGLGDDDRSGGSVVEADAVEVAAEAPSVASGVDARGSRPPTVEAGPAPSTADPTEPRDAEDPTAAAPVEDGSSPEATDPASSRRSRSPGSRPAAGEAREVTPSQEPAGDAGTGGDSGFAEELRLLKKAKAAADADRPEAALRLLDRAAERFGAGFFDEERRALRVRVLCTLGRDEAGRAAARAFFRDYPASPQTERVAHACD